MRNYEAPDGGWDFEREEADLTEAALITAGNRFLRRRVNAERLLAAGDVDGAARACPHGAGYTLAGECAKNLNDPRAGENGFRCTHCGTVLADYGGAILFPCEWTPERRG